MLRRHDPISRSLFALKGIYENISGEHLFYDTVVLAEDKNLFKIRIGRFEKRIIVIANEPENTKEQIEFLKKNKTCLFYYSENPINEILQTISINPFPVVGCIVDGVSVTPK